LTASEVGARAIAGNMDKNKDDRMEVENNWEEEKGEIEWFEEELESSGSPRPGYIERETKRRRYDDKEIMTFPYFGEMDDEETERTWDKIRKDVEEIRTGDVTDFTTDIFEDTVRRILEPKITKKEKKIEITAGANVIRHVVSGLEDQANIEIDRRKMYRKEYYRMKGLYISYRKKYETLIKKNTKEKGVQVGIEKEMDVDKEKRREEHREGRENVLEKKINHLIEKVNELERRIPGRNRNISKERKEEVMDYFSLEGKKDKRKGKNRNREFPGKK